MTMYATARIWATFPLGGNALVVALALSDRCDDTGAGCMPPMPWLAKECRLDEPAATYILVMLRNIGELEWDGKTGSEFRLNLRPDPQRECEAIPPRSKRRRGFVYVLHMRDSDIFKIGRASDAARRFEELMLPFEVDVIGVWAAEDMVAAEASLHGRFATQRIRGEWFRLSVEDLQTLREQCDKLTK